MKEHPEENLTNLHKLQHAVLDISDLMREDPMLEKRFPELASVVEKHVDPLTDAATDEFMSNK